MEAARREIREETHISRVRFHQNFKETIRFQFRWPPKSPDAEFRLKFVVYYLGQVFDSRVKISEEHKSFGWYAYEKASHMLKHKNSRELLAKAHTIVAGAQNSYRAASLSTDSKIDG